MAELLWTLFVLDTLGKAVIGFGLAVAFYFILTLGAE